MCVCRNFSPFIKSFGLLIHWVTSLCNLFLFRSHSLSLLSISLIISHLPILILLSITVSYCHSFIYSSTLCYTHYLHRNCNTLSRYSSLTLSNVFLYLINLSFVYLLKSHLSTFIHSLAISSLVTLTHSLSCNAM